MIPRLSELLGQPAASQFLRGVVATGRVGNAYLFHGTAGVGKCSAALAFARALMCDRNAPPAPEAPPDLFAAPAPAAPTAPLDDACGRCDQCLKVAALQHPDLKFLFPISGPEKEQDATIAETLEALRTDPLFVFQYDRYASIRLSLTRELLRDLSFRPYQAARRVVVVRDADRMREDQFSAMLKAIEEPGAQTVWVLTTARLHSLPATIRSRCQRVRFGRVDEALVLTLLREQAGLPVKQAKLIAALSAGSIGKALVLREGDPLRDRDEALALLEPAIRREPAAMWSSAQRYASFGKASREKLRRLVEFHQLWLRDLLRLRYDDVKKEDLVNEDRVDEMRMDAQAIDAREIRRRMMVLEEMLRAIEGNVSVDLALFSGLARIAGSRMGEGEWPRHATARWDY